MITIQLFGDIGDDACTPDAVSAALAQAGGEPVCVEINTNGGSVWDGLAIYNALTAYAGHVTCKVVGLAASMGSVIALAGDELVMADNAFLMIHNPSVCVEADAAGLLQTASWMEKVHATLATVYESRSGKAPAEVLAAMDAETWFTAEEAKAWGFADTIYTAKTTNKPTVRQVAAAYRAHKPKAAAPVTADPQLIMKEVNTMAKQAIRGAAVKAAPKAELPMEEKPVAEDMPAPAAVPASPETVQAVDTSSPNYAWGEKCGAEGIDTGSPEFIAGYQAGLAGKAAPAEEAAPEAEMTPEEEKPVAKLAAKISDLRAAFPHDSDTVFAAIENGWTLAQAKAHAFDKVSAQLVEANAKLKKATSGQGPVATSGARPAAASKPAGDDPKAQAEHEWDTNPEARKGFSTKERFVAIRVAEATGKLRA